jgi:hypothetical protein
VNSGLQLKYGWIRGGKVGYPIPIGLSEVINLRSGRFVKTDGSGRAEIAGDGHTALIGWLECEAITAASNDAEGKYTRNVINDLTAVFRLPIRYESATYTVNYSAAVLGKSCDLVVVAGIQYANLTDGDESTIIIVGGQAASAVAVNDGWVDVMINPAKISPTAL